MKRHIKVVAFGLATLGGTGRLFSPAASDAAVAGDVELPSQSRDISGDDPAPLTEPLINAPPKRTRTIAALMLDLGQGPPSMSQVASAMETVRQMYVEESYGMQDLAVDVVGPWKLPVDQCLSLACCGPSSDRTGNGPTVASAISSLPKTYDHYFYMYGPEGGNSNCGTWGDTGNPTTPAKYCSIEQDFQSGSSVYGIEQELGHNLGMQHEHTMSCSGGAVFPDDPSNCSHNEYGSRVSYMGGGQGHASAYHKVAQGWLSGCNVVKAAGPGTYTLLPLELPCDGTQVLQIPMAKTRDAPKGQVNFFYAELRTPTGRDKSSSTKPAVILYAGPDFPSARSYGGHTYLLTQLTAAGQSFSDPSGSPSLTVSSIGMASATITIAGGTGAPTCLDGSAFTPPGRDASSCAAAPATMSGGGATGTGGTASGGAGGGATGGRAGAAGGTAGRGGAGGSASGSGGKGSGGSASGGAVGTGGAAPGTGGTIGTGSGGSGTAGSGGSGAPATGGRSATGGTGHSGGAAGAATTGETMSGGCTCATPGGRTGHAAPVFLLALAVAATRRRRRRSDARDRD